MNRKVFVSFIVTALVCLSLAACGAPQQPAHVHVFGTDWEHDATAHWHECECNDRSDVEEHLSGDWVVDKEATDSEDGARHRVCTVCGYITVGETIHTFTQKEPAAKYLKAAATTESPALYYYSCKVCGESEKDNEHTFTYGNKLPEGHSHSYTVIESDETGHWYECSCGDKKEGGKTAHDSATWTADGDKHTGVCSVCDRPIEAHHVPGAWEEKGDDHEQHCDKCGALVATHKSDVDEWTDAGDVHTGVCSVCELPVSKGHTFEETVDDKCLVPGSDNGTTVSYYKSCECGKQSSDTFTVASHAHDTTAVKHDNDYHWQACSQCGKADESSKAVHDYDETNGWVKTKDATFDEFGEEKNTCRYTGCGYYKTRQVPKKVTVGFGANGFDTDTSTGYKVYRVEDGQGLKVTVAKTLGENWRIKINKTITCVASTEYEYTFVFTSSVEGDELMQLELPGDKTSGVTGAGMRAVEKGVNTFTVRFTATDTSIYTNLQLGKLPVGAVITLTEVKLVKIVSSVKTTVDRWVADPALTHDSHAYDINEHDDTHHWKECACGVIDESSKAVHDYTGITWTDKSGGKHSGVCKTVGCGYEKTEDHTPGAWTDALSTHEKTCDKCGALCESHTPDVDIWTDGGATHSGTCTCGLTVTANHTPCENWKIGAGGLAGKHYKDCVDCGHVTEQEDHDFKQVIDSRFLVPGSQTETKVSYYESCTCGAHSDTTFEVDIHEHNYTVPAHDDTYHWNECNVCHDVDESSKAEHGYTGEWTVVTAATYDAAGSESHKCDDCNYVATRAIPKLVDKGFGTHGVEIHKESTYSVSTAETSVGFEVTVTGVPATKTDWHLKIAKNVDVTVHELYEITYTFASSVSGTSLIKLEVSSGALVVGGDNFRDVSNTEDNVFTVRFVAQNAVTYTDLQLGLLDVNAKITLKDVTLKKIVSRPALTSYTAEDPMDGWGNEGHRSDNMTYTVSGSAITANVNSGWDNTGKNSWDIRVCFGTGYTVTSGNVYIVTAKVKSSGGDYDILFRKGAGWTSDYKSLNGGATATETVLTNSFRADSTNALSVWLQIGKLPGGAKLEIDEITVLEVGMATSGEATTVFHTVPVDVAA